MAYVEYRYVFRDSIEYEYRFCGHYGQRGERRSPRTRPSTEQMKRQNQWSRQKYLRRKVKLNFEEGDPLITLKYKAGARPPLDEVEKDFKRFRDRIRRGSASARRDGGIPGSFPGDIDRLHSLR